LLLHDSPHLSYLNVSYCKISAEGIETLLVAIKENKELTELKVFNFFSSFYQLSFTKLTNLIRHSLTYPATSWVHPVPTSLPVASKEMTVCYSTQ